MQGVGEVKWSPGKDYQMEGVWLCRSLTVMTAGEVVVLVRTQKGKLEVRWYNQQGKLLHTAPRPPQCDKFHAHLSVLAVEVGGKQQVALSCWECECIWLGTGGTGGFGKILRKVTGAWSVAWEPTGAKERGRQPRPGVMCQGKPGQIIAVNGYDGESVSVFDIMQIPFRLVVPEIKLGMQAEYLCYCELPGIGEVLAVTDGNIQYKLCMFSLDGGTPLWSVGDKVKMGKSVKVAGAEWWPVGLCSDNRGRLYVADCEEGTNRIIVFSAASGSVLQVVQGRGHWEYVGRRRSWVADPGITVYGPDIKYKDDEPEKGVTSGSVLQEFKNEYLEQPWHLCWHEQSQSIIVGSFSKGKACSFKITF